LLLLQQQQIESGLAEQAVLAGYRDIATTCVVTTLSFTLSAAAAAALLLLPQLEAELAALRAKAEEEGLDDEEEEQDLRLVRPRGVAAAERMRCISWCSTSLCACSGRITTSSKLVSWLAGTSLAHCNWVSTVMCH
jgi:hypothetical protein